MSDRCIRANLIPHTALFAIALGWSYSLWAMAPAALTTDIHLVGTGTNELRFAKPLPSDLQLAMMDEKDGQDGQDGQER